MDNQTKLNYVVWIIFLLAAVVEANHIPGSLALITERSDEICGVHNGRKLYLELGERGVIEASNVTARTLLLGANSGQPSHVQCSMEIVTCPSCVLTIHFRHLNLSTCSQDLSCRCDYVWITEPPYEASGRPFCGLTTEGSLNKPSYRSQTRIVNVALLFSTNHIGAFVLEYAAERNRQVLGTASVDAPKYDFNNTITRGGIFNSPFFPEPYPRDLGVEYVISANDPRARVQVLFSDFQLAASSIIEFYDWNGQRIDVTSGASFRPAAIVSTGPSLLVRFYANGGASLGYRAAFTIISATNSETTLKPITDCGGFVENPGGAITMMHMADADVKHYDCIWIIKPPRNYFHLKTHLYVKIAQFSDFGGNTELVVRQGTTSQGVTLETLRSPVTEVLGTSRAHKELVIPVDDGFYISLRGAFAEHSKLAIIYAAFSYMDCFAGADFLCKNHRCISNRLSCDGFDHCGDGSDEPAATCFQDWSEASALDRNWYSNTPNYYFPKIERYPDLKTATLVFLVSSLGLILLIVALIVLLYRMGARARQQRELQNRLQTISELLDGARIEDMPPDEPPTYEAPPDYDEVIKVGSCQSPVRMVASPGGSGVGTSMASGRSGKRKDKTRGIKNPRRRTKSSPGVCLNTSSARDGSLRVALPMSPEPHAATPTSWTDLQGGSAPVLLLARNLPTSPVPDSPPPPYGTSPSLADLGCGSSVAAESVDTNASQLQQMENTQPSPLQSDSGLLDTFEDSFSGVLKNCINEHGHVLLENISSNSMPSDSQEQQEQSFNVLLPNLQQQKLPSTSAIEQLQDELYYVHRRICKLASVERFDDFGMSFDSVASTAPRAAVANVDDPGPSAVASTSSDQVASDSRLDAPNKFAFPDINAEPSTSLMQSATDVTAQAEGASRSCELLKLPNTMAVTKQIREPDFNESTKLLNSDKSKHNFDLQIQLLKAQILEQNTKLSELQLTSRILPENVQYSPKMCGAAYKGGDFSRAVAASSQSSSSSARSSESDPSAIVG